MASHSAGLFITLEGGEGAGKSTLLRALAMRFEASGENTVATREPGGTPLAEAIRELVLHPPHDESWSPMAEAMLMNAARSEHLNKLIRPALAGGSHVLCDRFADSTRAYQSVLGGVPLDVLRGIELAVLEDTVPNITFILDAPPEDLLDRRRSRANVSDAFERRDMDFHRAVREAFLQISIQEPSRCHVVDAMLSESDLLSAAWAIIDTHRQELGTQ